MLQHYKYLQYSLHKSNSQGGKEKVRVTETFELQWFAKFAKSPHYLKTLQKETVNLAYSLPL